MVDNNSPDVKKANKIQAQHKTTQAFCVCLSLEETSQSISASLNDWERSGEERRAMAVSPQSLAALSADIPLHLLDAAKVQVLDVVLQFLYQSPALGFSDVKAAFSYVLLVKPVHLSLRGPTFY